QILKRTNTSQTVLQKQRTATTDNSLGQASSPVSESSQIPKHPNEPSRSDGPVYPSKDKKKGVSFLSRIIGGNKKRSPFEVDNEDESETGDSRPEGMDAQLFSQPIENLGFSPRHPQPPGYIKVRARFKKEKEFNRVFLAQELRKDNGAQKSKRISTAGPAGSSTPGSDPVWALEFSKDGKYLAAGGQDKVVRVWAVLSSPEERRSFEKEEEEAGSISSDGQGRHLSAPVFQKNPVREYEGHTSTILDLSWSKNNFLLSSSMDKTVRLWHVTRAECLCTFKHTDFVPSIQFHPKDDRFFLAGSLDSKLRLWSIPDKSVAFWNQVPDMITAVAFTPDGKTAIAGTLSGLCMFYDTEGLKHQTQIHVRSSHGKNARGSKITGIQTMAFPPGSSNHEVKLLISSNDSRVRLYNFRDKSLEIKFKGYENNHSQIRASFSDDSRYVICGSEDRKAYIWSTGPPEGEKNNQRPLEMFEAHSSITTTAIFAPTLTRQVLGNSEDPIFDLCNPPPVTLVSRTESMTSRPATENGSIQETPAVHKTNFKRAEESPAYIARSVHNHGNIIVTADFRGCIKVFRQDCAWNKRRNDSWDTGSIISRRVGTSLIGRTNSIATRASGRTRADSTSTQPPSDRILSWRQAIASSGSLENAKAHRKSWARSVSPRKSVGALSHASNPNLNPTPVSAPPQKPLPSDKENTQTHTSTNTRTSSPSSHSHPSASTSKPGTTTTTPSPFSPTSPPKENQTQRDANPLWIHGTQSYVFWNTQNWRNAAAHDHLAPPSATRAQDCALDGTLSKKTSGKAGGGEEVRCGRCGSQSFRARVKERGEHWLVCMRCGTAA
ncbi:WD40 repeat-like protein, partial [Patellaria atrata CBS 101060]